MDLGELQKEQLKLAAKVVLKDDSPRIKTIGGIDCVASGNELIACVVVCEFPSMKLLETKTYILADPFRYVPGFQAYREMPAMIEVYNQLDQEPDLLLVSGAGIAHPRKIGLASHLGLILNKATVGVTEKLMVGNVQHGKIMFDNEIVGFEITTREHSNAIYVSPGHFVSLGGTLNLISQTIVYPHKMPEPLYIAHKVARKKGKQKIEMRSEMMVDACDKEKRGDNDLGKSFLYARGIIQQNLGLDALGSDEHMPSHLRARLLAREVAAELIK